MLALVHPYTPGSDVCSPSQTLSSSRQTRTPLPARKSSSHTSTVDRERVERVTVPSTALSPSNGRRSSSRTAPENHPSSSATTATNIGSSSSAPSPRIGPARTPPPVDVPSKPVDQPPQTEKSAAGSFDIHAYPATDLLRLLASLLTQIAATNDALSTSTSPTPTPAPRSPNSHAPTWAGMFGASRAALATPSAPLAFHARNIPTISLEAYLLRILKYCPATNEVFLALLVYFDRMSRLSAEATGRSFVIDSYNIHRLVIAGVTVASKFFSDVFYTNSRYAKVGGLPQAELNQLELQFLLLNDFRLVISAEEMQRYAEQLVLFSTTSHPAASASTTASSAPAMNTANTASVNGNHTPIATQAADTAIVNGTHIEHPMPPPPSSAISTFPSSDPSSIHTPPFNGQHPSSTDSGGYRSTPPPPSTPSSSIDGNDTASEAGTEGGDISTDEEPTIRPSISRSTSTSSVSSSAVAGFDEHDHEDDHELGFSHPIHDGERTPERTPATPRDAPMGSPGP